MKLSEVIKDTVVEHVRTNQGYLRAQAVKKIGVVISEELFCSARSIVPDLVEVAFFVHGRQQVDRVRYNKLKVLPASAMPVELTLT